jgi:adenine-specific DNA-methyltransferase
MKYVRLARQRIKQELAGTLRTRPMNKPVYDPTEAGNSLTIAPWTSNQNSKQMRLLEKPKRKQRYVTR